MLQKIFELINTDTGLNFQVDVILLEVFFCVLLNVKLTFYKIQSCKVREEKLLTLILI